MGLPGPRALYNRFEKLATPLANDLTRTQQFSQAVGLIAGVRNSVRVELGKLAARTWHAVNLPAGTDVQQLRRQVGALDRDFRLMSLALERARKAVADREADPGQEHD